MADFKVSVASESSDSEDQDAMFESKLKSINQKKEFRKTCDLIGVKVSSHMERRKTVFRP